MIANLIEKSALYIITISDGLSSRIRQRIGLFPGFDHLAYLFADLGDMFRNLFQYLFLVGKSGFFQSDLLDTDDILYQRILIFKCRREDMTGAKLSHNTGFDLYFFYIFLQFNLM